MRSFANQGRRARRRPSAFALVYSIAVLLPTTLALSACDSDDGEDGPPAVTIVAPLANEVISTFTFAVEIATDAASLEAGSVRAELNDAALPLTSDGSRYTANVVAGPPLRDDNRLEIHARTSGGDSVVSEVAFRYMPPKARARRISERADLIQGPLAHGQVGDYLLENSVARFIVQDGARRDLANVGTYGGNIIDAELVAAPGNDNFLELQPMVNIETVLNAQSVEIVRDGQDGTAAILRTCGPDDPLDFINPSSNIREMLGVELPTTIDDADYPVEGCTEYALEPEVAHVRLETTIENQGDSEFGLFVGDYIAAGGALDPWQVSVQGRSGIGEILTVPVTALSLIGFDDGDGRDYFYVPVSGAGQLANSDVLSIAGVNVVLHGASIVSSIGGAPPAFTIAPGDTRSFLRYFGVGNGSGANAVDLVHALRGVATGTIRGCVAVAGVPVEGARVAVGRSSAGIVRGLTTHFRTGADGCYSGTLPAGDWGAAAARDRTPYEQNNPTPLARSFTIEAGAVTMVDFDLPPPGRLEVRVTDESGRAIPARITLVGFDPSPEPGIPTTSPVGSTTTWLFRDLGDDSLTYGVADFQYADAEGRARLDVKPGQYTVVVSRGTEYSRFDRPLTIAAGEEVVIDARIARVLDTTGFVSSDFHVHGVDSTDSRTGLVKRVLQYAGEGIENIVMTEHNGRTDLMPTIEALDMRPHVYATIGEEITTWEYGHYNGYPFDLVPEHQTEGSVDWAGRAEPGRDFVAYGSYGLTPAQLDAAAHAGPGARPSTVVQANHVAGYFGPLQIDTSLVPPRSFLDAAGKLSFRLDPASDNLFHPFAAMEVWNGHGRRHQNRFFNGEIGIWFNLLNQGLHTSGTGVTDSHGFYNLNATGARTWTASSTDDVSRIDPDDVADQVAAGRATLGQGLFLEAQLRRRDGTGSVATFAAGGSTTLSAAGAEVELVLRAQAPLWAPFDRIEVYANAATMPVGQSGGTNVFFGAEPTLVLNVGDDFLLDDVDVFPEIPGARRWQADIVVPFPGLTEDTWFVAIARGTDGRSGPMFPVVPADLPSASNPTLADLMDGNLGESGVLSMAVTNPLYADLDGEAGFQAPNQP